VDKSFIILKNESYERLWFMLTKIDFQSSSTHCAMTTAFHECHPFGMEPRSLFGLELVVNTSDARPLHPWPLGGPAYTGIDLTGRANLLVWAQKPQDDGSSPPEQSHEIKINIHLRRDLSPAVSLQANWLGVCSAGLMAEEAMESALRRRVVDVQ
jgi:hypothetical protein